MRAIRAWWSASISGYGQDGPYSQRAGHDLNYIGYAGLLAHLARPGEPPVLPGAQFADIAGGSLMAVSGILAALVGRAATGEGRYIDVSMTDGALSLLPILGTRVLNGTPEPAPGEAELTGALPGYNIYATSDGRYLTVGALEPKFFEESLPATWAARSGRAPVPRDAADRDATIAELAAIFRTKTRDEWLAELADADVCVGPVNTTQRGAGRSPTAGARPVADAEGGPPCAPRRTSATCPSRRRRRAHARRAHHRGAERSGLCRRRDPRARRIRAVALG